MAMAFEFLPETHKKTMDKQIAVSITRPVGITTGNILNHSLVSVFLCIKDSDPCPSGWYFLNQAALQ
jgi:hypothetical protein